MAICRAQRLRGPSGGGLVDSAVLCPAAPGGVLPRPPAGRGCRGRLHVHARVCESVSVIL